MLLPFVSVLRSRKRLSPQGKVALHELDELLDVPVAAFDKSVERLTKEFRKAMVQLEVPQVLVPTAGSSDASRVTWTGLYEAQIHQLSRLERAEEFRMARRYEFARARARAALRELGLTRDEVDGWFANPSTSVLDHAVGQAQLDLDAETRGYLRSCLADFLAVRNLFVQLALPLVPSSAQRYRGLGVDFSDLVQEGNSALFQAVDGFDWRRDVRFKTYAQYWIQQAILKVLYNASRTVRVPVWVQKALKKIQRVRDRKRLETGVEPPSELVGEELGISGERVESLLATRRYATSIDAELPGEDGGTLASLLPDMRNHDVREIAGDDGLRARIDEAMADLPDREKRILTRRFGLDGKEPETLGEIARELGVTAERVRQLQNVAIERLQRPGKRDLLKSYAL
jgi:RNA polymerase primary sigma factor